MHEVYYANKQPDSYDFTDKELSIVVDAESFREVVKAHWPGCSLSMGRNYGKLVHSITIKVPGAEDRKEQYKIETNLGWFAYLVHNKINNIFKSHAYYVDKIDIKVSAQNKVLDSIKVTEETFVDALVKLGFNAKWANSTNNIYNRWMMKAIIVKEGDTFLVYNFNRGHGFIKTLSEKGKPASEVSSITDILGQPQIIFDSF